MAAPQNARIGVAGLAVMGQVRVVAPLVCHVTNEGAMQFLTPRFNACAQNLALNIAEKGYVVALYNRTESKTDDTCARARAEGALYMRDATLLCARALLTMQPLRRSHRPGRQRARLPRQRRVRAVAAEAARRHHDGASRPCNG
jgi:hypothetical protein